MITVNTTSDDLTFTDDTIHWNNTRLKTNWHYVVIVEANYTDGTINSSTVISKFFSLQFALYDYRFLLINSIVL